MLINAAYLGDPLEDVEEELFGLYTRRAGFDNTRSDALDSIVLSEGSSRSALGLINQRDDSVDLQFTYSVKDEAVRSPKKRKSSVENQSRTLEITLAQNITALRSRAGDTGGGVWRGSVLLAQTLLQQLYSPTSQECFFNKEALSSANVLELGSGTGLLGIVLAPFTGHHTCTDLPDLVPLIKKNLSLNTKLLSGCSERLSYDALDWSDVHNCSPAARKRLFLKNPSSGQSNGPRADEELFATFDLILAVDCVYNPSLIPPLLTTIDLYAIPGRSVVIVAMELRDEDVVREFLTQWSQMPGWELRPVGNDMHAPLLDERFAIWVGSKEIVTGN